MLPSSTISLKIGRRILDCFLIEYRVHVFRQDSRDIVIKTAASDVRDAVKGNIGIHEALDRFPVAGVRLEERFAMVSPFSSLSREETS